jgi:hypothetical protein
MKAYFGFESTDKGRIQGIKIIDYDEDFIIIDDASAFYEKYAGDPPELIPLLNIKPKSTTFLFHDYGFFSERGRCFVFQEMLCGFQIVGGEEQEREMFLLQLNDELVVVAEQQDKLIYLISSHNKELVKKWAQSYNINIEFSIYEMPTRQTGLKQVK